MEKNLLELLETKWRSLYQVYDMIDSSDEGYQEIKKQLEALETVIEMFNK